ncbi:DUF760 domain-containing protein [Synechocystis salina LEGE 06099]|uniref:DUF760 domain-containing protein n=1 Tax=Synechocystis salina TaxID=945780 RepID=UPI00187FE494|nr:DUF760 domain-containing protein [Synechocystis salina]MBE9204204.1 DUF760 domain-containing protein [Synechocystis salina LEGE 06099]
MTHEPQRPQPLFAGNETAGKDSLWTYVQELSPETIVQLSRPDSQEVFQVMERNIIGLLGNLPPDHFGVTISTSRENLGRLLASAMMSGYFLRNAEQRLGFEQAFKSTGNNGENTEY